MKSDNPELIGKHAFEAAGLGKPPYKFMGITQEVFNNGDGTTKPGGCCKYCYAGILWAFWLKSSDGHSFCVGSECINRSGDKGLIEAYKSSPEYRALQKAKRDERDRIRTAEIDSLLADVDVITRLMRTPSPTRADRGETGYDHAMWVRKHSGASGRSHLHKWIKGLLHGAPPTDEQIFEAHKLLAERRQAEESAERAAEAAKETARLKASALAPLADRLDDGNGGFRSDVADGLRRGIIPKGRGLGIMLDILAKQAGRSGSRAYSREYDSLVDLLDQFEPVEGQG